MEAQKLLDNAMYYERRKNWEKAILCYGDLQTIFREDAFKKMCVEAQDEMRVLQFQCHFHCAVAHQKLAEHGKATNSFEKAIKSLQSKKNDCGVGFLRGKNMHWSVPANSRKAFSEIHLGNLKEAHKSAESALALDVSNPDMFCIRALVRFLSGESEKAVADVTQANKLNSSHICSLLLRIWFARHKDPNFAGQHRNRKWSKDEEKAYEINPSVVAYFECTDIKERFTEIFERYLPTIRCCHTVTVYDVLQLSHTRREAKVNRRGKAVAASVSRSADNVPLHTRKLRSCPASTEVSTVSSQLYSTSGDKETRVKPSRTEIISDITSLEDTSSELHIDTKNKKQTSLPETVCCQQCSSMEEFLRHLICGKKD